KKIVEAIKTVDPTSTLEQMPYETDASGNVIYENGVPKLSYAMIERKISGKDRDAIALAIRSALTPEDLRQLQITGRYKLKNASREEIAENLVARVEKRYRNQILYKHDILEKLALNPEGEYKEMLERNLGEVEEFLGKIEKDLSQEIRTILSTEDFNGYKSNFYAQNLIEDITNAFSSKTIEEKLVANPILNGY